jgi:hypothetical protein
MKPRWKVQPHTFEDVEIRMLVDMRFLHLAGRPLLEWPSFSWILSDRRDADLMLKLTKLPALHIIRATCGLDYPDIEAIISEWIG